MTMEFLRIEEHSIATDFMFLLDLVILASTIDHLQNVMDLITVVTDITRNSIGSK